MSHAGIANERKRVAREPDPIPSPEQFERIVEAIRYQRFADHAQDSAEAWRPRSSEGTTIPWQDFDFTRPAFSSNGRRPAGILKCRFILTSRTSLSIFTSANDDRTGMPKYSESLIVRRRCDDMQAIGFPHFSPRSLRKFGIVRLLRNGVNVKLVSKWQGHQDGGKLILDSF